MKELTKFKAQRLIDVLWEVNSDCELKGKKLWIMSDEEILFYGFSKDILKVIGSVFFIKEVEYVFSNDESIDITVKEVE